MGAKACYNGMGSEERMKYKKIWLASLSLFLLGCTHVVKDPQPTASATAESVIARDTECDDKACVSLYLQTYQELPGNYMTKKEARSYGWERGALHLVVDGKCIGGDVYGNREGTLPGNNTYHECDIDTLHSKKRGAKRIVYSEDGDIWYTEDHYETFELLAGDGQ